VQSQITSAPSSISQAAATAALNGPQHPREQMRLSFQHRRNLISRALGTLDGIEAPLPQGAFYYFPSVVNFIGARDPHGELLTSDTAIAAYLLRIAKVAVVPGSAFGAPGWLRISYALSEPNLEIACGRIAFALSDLRRS